MTGSQIVPNIVSQDVTAFIATGVIAYPQQDPAYEGKYRGALRDIRSQDLSRPDPRSEYPDGTPALFRSPWWPAMRSRAAYPRARRRGLTTAGLTASVGVHRNKERRLMSEVNRYRATTD